MRRISWFCVSARALLLGLFLLSPMAVESAPVGAAPLHLSSQLQVDQQELAVSESDWHWLRQKRDLVLGVAGDAEAPMAMLQRDGSFEGITADTTALVGQMLGMRIVLRELPDQAALARALESGEIDMTTASSHGLRGASVARSQPFAIEHAALFRRQEDTREFPADLAGLTVVTTTEYLGDPALHRGFPSARLVAADSVDGAMAAVAFGKADLYLGDVLAAYYRINRGFHGMVRFERFAELKADGVAFIVRSGDAPLLRGLDATLHALGRSRLDEITRRWIGSGVIPALEPLPLTQEERRWVERHPVVRLVIDDDMAPMAFFDAQGQFRGITADLLEMTSLRTGLRFEAISRRGGFTDQISSLQQGSADLAILSQGREREALLRFTRPVMTNPFVLVAPRGDDGLAEPLDGMEGKRLAIARGHVALAEVRDTYPGAEIVEAGSTLDAMNLVYGGGADAALVSLPTARYYVVRLFRNRLAVAELVPIEPATANFAMRRADVELQSILDKALASLAPDELNAAANRWRGSPAMSAQTWRDYNQLILQIVIGALVLLALALAWGLRLRREVRKRMTAERQLNDELRFIETLIDCMPQPVFVRDVEGRLLSCNRSYLDTLGLAREDILGTTAPELPLAFEAAPLFHQGYLKAMVDGQLVRGVHELELGGRRLWIEHWTQPFQDSTGAVKGVICGWIDITEHHHLVRELEEAKNLADDASRAKTAFLATMSHEIRTPLNAVIGILELALKRAEHGPIDPAGIQVAYGSARSLLTLIGDILDIARIEAGRLSLAPARANLRELVESVARVFDGLARQKRLELVLEIDSSIQGDVLVDAMRFKQILSNLVSNAIKFTPEGRVGVRVTGDLAEPGMLRVVLVVEDSGIGIAPEDQARLFQPFSRIEQADQLAEGTGLGLVICRSLCTMMGGRLALDSEPGRGTRVEVELRLHRLDPVPEPVPTPSPLAGPARRLRVLVVDDHPVNRQILQQQLVFLGHEAEEAADGQDALQRWRARHFDAVATDCHMPRMSGAELTAAIRREEREGVRPRTLVLGLTADAQADEIERGLAAGMDECLAKPIGLAALQRVFGVGEGELLEAEGPSVTGLFDLSPLQPLTGGDPLLVRNLLGELMATNGKDLALLGMLLERGDSAGLSELAHRLIGAARVVRAEEVIAACQRLMAACAVPSTPDGLRRGVEDLVRALERLQLELSDYLTEGAAAPAP